jgi:hypothetical protein
LRAFRREFKLFGLAEMPPWDPEGLSPPDNFRLSSSVEKSKSSLSFNLMMSPWPRVLRSFRLQRAQSLPGYRSVKSRSSSSFVS